MAVVFGENVLSEVKAETLDELLHSLRDIANPLPRDILGVPALDDILSKFVSPPGRQQDLHPQWATPSPKQSIPSMRKTKPPVIELCGASPCSGKTQLLYNVAAASLLHPTPDADTLCPKGGAVIWIDTDSRFDIHRLHSILESRTSDRHDDLEYSWDPRNAIEASLQHLHIFRPQSSSTLLATLQAIPSYLFSLRKHLSGSHPLRALIISNISAFLHQIRLDSDLARDANPSHVSGTSAQPPDSLVTQHYRDIVNALRETQKTFSCSIIAGNMSLSPLQPSSLGPTHRPHLPGAWTSFCAVKIFVMRKTVSKFGPSLSVEEAELDADARRQAVKRSGFRAWVDPWGGEAWETGVREAVEKNGGFEFKFNGAGVWYAEDERTA